MKKAIIYFVIIVAAIIGLAMIGASDNNLAANSATSPTPSKENVEKQLADVNKKIEQLPDLEEDIFGKCIQEKGGTSAENIKSCEGTTQTQIFTLAQDLNNLKKDLEGKLK